jgi:hypothetical protein
MRPNGQTDSLYEANIRFSQVYEQANRRIAFSTVNIDTAKHHENAKNIIAWAKQLYESGRRVYWTACTCILVGSSAVISLTFF